jgi:hypothetical protein
MRTRLATGLVAATVISLVLLRALPLQATSVRPMDLDHLTQAAGMIVAGKVTHVESRPDQHGLPATFITIAVTEKIKGVQEDALTIKQLGFQELPGDGRAMRLAGMPSYRLGEDVLLFLHQPSELGFTSPVGLGQGKYTVFEGAPGKRLVQNLFGNRNLFPQGQGAAGATEAGLALESSQGRGLDYEIFVRAIKRRVLLSNE